jgi:hypothetical protein
VISDPNDQIRFGYQLASADFQNGESFLIHQGVRAGFGNRQRFLQVLCIQYVGKLLK